MRYRKGSKGIYYTDGKLDNCYYNDKNASFFDLVKRERITSYDISQLLECLIYGLQGILFLLILPIVPVVRAIYVKKNIKGHDIETEHFPQGYYQEVDD